MRLLPGVRYENTVDSLGMSFGTVGAERRRRAPRLEQRHRRRRGRQRSRQQRPDGAADQPRRDRRGPRAAELLSRRVRPRRRRPGADRQQERHVELPRQPLPLRPQRSAQRQRLLQQPVEHQEAALSLQHLRRQPRRAGPGAEQADKKLFFFYSLEAPLVSRPGPARNWTMPTDRPRCRGLLADAGRAGPARSSSEIRWRPAPATPSRGGPACFPGNIIPANRHQLERPGAAEHAAAREQLRPHLHAGAVQLHDAGERREPEDEQHRADGLEADGERQLLLHLQGLVLGPARQRNHRRAGQVGLLQHPLPEHGSRHQRELHEDPPLEPRSSTPTSGSVSRPSSSIR